MGRSMDTSHKDMASVLAHVESLQKQLALKEAEISESRQGGGGQETRQPEAQARLRDGRLPEKWPGGQARSARGLSGLGLRACRAHVVPGSKST